jgi:hypothetical protein
VGYQILALVTVIKISTFYQRLPIADGHYSYSKVCMFFQPVAATQRQGEDLGQRLVPVYTGILFVLKASVAL